MPKSNIAIFAAGLICLFLSIIYWPIPVLTACNSNGKVVLERPLLIGQGFTMRIIHSVERTPVEDEYRIVHQKIWSWQERVRSHNAGLPIDANGNGSFLVRSPWFIIQGGRLAFDHINYRVGLENLGNNRIRFDDGAWQNLYDLYPAQRLVFSVGSKTICEIFTAQFIK